MLNSCAFRSVTVKYKTFMIKINSMNCLKFYKRISHICKTAGGLLTFFLFILSNIHCISSTKKGSEPSVTINEHKGLTNNKQFAILRKYISLSLQSIWVTALNFLFNSFIEAQSNNKLYTCQYGVSPE